MNNKNHLRFEFTDESGYKTVVEKEWGSIASIDSVMAELRYCLLACGFSEELVDEYITDKL